MKIWKVLVFADNNYATDSEIVEIEQEHKPTEEELEEIYHEHIGDILDTGCYLLDEKNN